MDERQLQQMMAMGGGQQMMMPSPQQEAAMKEAETKQIRILALQLVVQAGIVTNGAEGLVDDAKTVAAYVNGE